jgi:hypothetical protein
METDEFVAHAPLGAEVLEAWIEAGWLLPRQDGAKRNFFDVDLARAPLIHDLVPRITEARHADQTGMQREWPVWRDSRSNDGWY